MTLMLSHLGQVLMVIDKIHMLGLLGSGTGLGCEVKEADFVLFSLHADAEVGQYNHIGGPPTWGRKYIGSLCVSGCQKTAYCGSQLRSARWFAFSRIIPGPY